jgi:hypothetical protein
VWRGGTLTKNAGLQYDTTCGKLQTETEKDLLWQRIPDPVLPK